MTQMNEYNDPCYNLDFLESIEKALVIATQQHRNQVRKGKGELYIHHPLRIMHSIRSSGIADHTCLVGAILHDVVEDTDFTINDVESEFGKEVSNIVHLLTRTDDLTYDQYINRLIESNDPYALIIKFFDAHDNSIWLNLDGSTKPIKKYVKLKELLRERIVLIGYGSFITPY